jgi:hypothetical protein
MTGTEELAAHEDGRAHGADHSQAQVRVRYDRQAFAPPLIALVEGRIDQ